MKRLLVCLSLLISMAGGANAGLVVSITDYEIPEGSLGSPVTFDVRVENTGPSAQSFNFFRLDFQIATLANPTGNVFRFDTPQPDSALYRSAGNNYALGSFGAATNVTGLPKSFMTINGGGSSVTVRDGIVTNQGPNLNLTTLAAGESKLLARLTVEAVDGSFNFGDKFQVIGSAVRDSGDPVVFHGTPGFTPPTVGTTKFTGFGLFTINDNGTPGNLGDDSWVLSYNAQDPLLGAGASQTFGSGTFNAVPEPSTYALMGLAIGGLAGWKRLRRKSA